MDGDERHPVALPDRDEALRRLRAALIAWIGGEPLAGSGRATASAPTVASGCSGCATPQLGRGRRHQRRLTDEAQATFTNAGVCHALVRRRTMTSDQAPSRRGGSTA